MNNLSGKYLVDKIEWRDGKTISSDGSKLPSEYWFDVDMNDEFWINHVEKWLPPIIQELTELSPTERESLEEFFWEYLDKVFKIEPVFCRIRKLEEIRDNIINEILDIENDID